MDANSIQKLPISGIKSSANPAQAAAFQALSQLPPHSQEVIYIESASEIVYLPQGATPVFDPHCSCSPSSSLIVPLNTASASDSGYSGVSETQSWCKKSAVATILMSVNPRAR